jgi:hypothetical protein
MTDPQDRSSPRGEIARAWRPATACTLTGAGLARDPHQRRNPTAANRRALLITGWSATLPDAPTYDRHPDDEGSDSGHRTQITQA